MQAVLTQVSTALQGVTLNALFIALQNTEVTY